MNLLMGLLVAKAIGGKKVNTKQLSRSIRKEARFWVQLVTELSQLISVIFKFIFVGIAYVFHKCVSQRKTVEVEKLPENVIKFDEYKLKKQKSS